MWRSSMPISCRRRISCAAPCRRWWPISGLAFVQARWGHANRSANWLTRVQGLLLDCHFAVEQEGALPRRPADLLQRHGGRVEPRRDRTWRRLDRRHADRRSRSFHALRAARAGARRMCSDLEVPGELPETAAAWRAQQARWTKGHAQCARKLLPVIWTSDLPLWKKAAMTLQMCQFAFYTLALLQRRDLPDPDVHGRRLYPERRDAGSVGDRRSGSRPASAISIWARRCWAASEAACLARSLLLALVFPERPDPGQYARHLRSLLLHPNGFQAHPARGRDAMSAAGAAGRN